MITISQISYKLPLEQWERDVIHRIFSRSFCIAGNILFLNLGYNYTRFWLISIHDMYIYIFTLFHLCYPFIIISKVGRNELNIELELKKLKIEAGIY